MSEIKFFTGEKVPLEMHKVRIVQKLNLPPVERRLEAIGEAGNNTFLLKNADIFLDMALEKLGIDVINVSCGIYETGSTCVEPISFPQGWRHDLIKAVKEHGAVFGTTNACCTW